MRGIPDRRETVRVARPIDIQYRHNCPPISARIEDLSEGGVFVDTRHTLTVGTVVHYSFSLPGEVSQAIAGRARVVWSAPHVGVGLQFLDLSEPDRDRLRFFVASVFFGHDAARA